MANKKNNTKKVNEEIKIERNEELINELGITEEEWNAWEETQAEFVKQLRNLGMQDEQIKAVIGDDKLEAAFVELIKNAPEKESFIKKVTRKASETYHRYKKQFDIAGIVTATAAVVGGSAFAVCNIGDDDESTDVYTEEEPEETQDDYFDEEGRHHCAVIDSDGKEYDLITEMVPKEIEEVEETEAEEA